MPLNVKTELGSGNFGPKQPVLDPGTYPARIVQILDFGVQEQRPYKGVEKDPAHEMSLTYELLDVFMIDEDGNDIENKPRWISEIFPIFNLGADRAKSTVRYKALDPDMVFEGDFTKLIGTPCNVTVVINKNNDKVYENVASASLMRPKDASKAPELMNDTRILLLDEENIELFNGLPNWIKEKITSGIGFSETELGAKLESV